MRLVTPATLTRVWPLVSSQFGRGLDGALGRAQVTVGVDRDLDQVLGAVTHDDGVDSPDAAFTGPGIGRPSAAVASCTFFEANFSRSLALSQFLKRRWRHPLSHIDAPQSVMQSAGRSKRSFDNHQWVDARPNTTSW
ncbi:hypothetical protein [Nonomuraea bangladeshensis]|uniref:hypothetical protein n=1 Tax=Nonomuraea bangladeshensis TaxID=404385 RepID=UPI003C2F775D